MPLQRVSRRRFLTTAALTTGACAVPAFTFASNSDRKLRVGIVGGRFGATFQFHEHPNCTVEAVSDLRADRRATLMRVYRCAKSHPSLDELLRDRRIEAVFLATPAPDHVRHVVAALAAGKHVLCAVPAALTLDECAELRDAVRRSGLTYMMAETSMWRQNMISAKKFHAEGRFGRIFSAEAEYHHPGLETLWHENGQPTWRHGLPPMLYPTHCTAFLVGLTGERLTSVSCVGWGDDDPLLRGNPYGNPFWNETALFRSDRGTAFRVDVYWRGAVLGTERAAWRGDRMSFFSPHPNGSGALLIHAGRKTGRDDGGFKIAEPAREPYAQPVWWKTEALPEPLRHASGHDGSHTFITHEFIDAIVMGRRPEVDVNQALAFTAPGIVAHQSALQDGALLKVPSFDA